MRNTYQKAKNKNKKAMFGSQGGNNTTFAIFFLRQSWVWTASLLLAGGIFLLLLSPFAAQAIDNNITPRAVLNLINTERDHTNLKPLTINDVLTLAAQQKAHDIITAQQFAHNINDRSFSSWVKDAGYDYSLAGENLAINFNDTQTLFNAWLVSPTHKQNVAHPEFRDVGIATVPGDWYGEETTIVVALFGAPANSTTSTHNATVAGTTGNSTNTPLPINQMDVPLLTSNLPESYLTAVSADADSTSLFREHIVLTIPNEKKNAVEAAYLGAAFQIMSGMMGMLLLLALGVTYWRSLISFQRRAQSLQEV